MDVSDLLNSLNDAQREAVCAPLSNQLVLAGAGSGKTRVLVQRIAWLMRVENLGAQQILAVTFTNKAAAEMRERLGPQLGSEFAVRSMWVGTFHGLAHRLLRQHWQEAKLPQNFQILDSDDQLRLIKRIYADLQIDDSRWPHRQAQGFINGKKDDGLRAAYIQDSFDPYTKVMKQIYLAYEQACERAGVVDFAELLLRSHELWLNNKNLLEHYQRRFSAILVDEFQDTNSIQYAWLRVLAGNSAALTVVGDDDQSIYGWRGAKIENIHKFEQDFAPVQVTRLEQNYRSTATILKAANAVIENNGDRLGKTLWTDGADGEAIDLYAAFNEQDEARYIVDQVQRWRDDGTSANDIALLYRSNAQSRVLEEAFIRADVPYRIYGGQRFYERLEIKNALAYMRLLSNRNDDNAFERVVNTPTRGIGNKTLDTLRLFARDQGSSLFDAAQGAIANNVFSARAANALQAFLELLNTLEDQCFEQQLGDIASIVVDGSGLLDFHAQEKGERGQARVENLQELVSACRAFESDDDDVPVLDAFLDKAALDAGDTQADDYEEAVQMMTLHSAKGLEFPFVVLAGMEEGLFPHRMSAEEPGRLEEERRLAYVGLTRAMHKLVLCYAESRRLYGKETFNSPSRFVREIPNGLVNEVRMKKAVSRPAQFQQQSLSDTVPGMSLGQLVSHPVFGEGTILAIEGQGAAARLQINFAGEGTKWLMLQYAKLEVL
ncbi:DNA helicase II [Agaribacterium haliotis]|uniref:DNA helicase II n=1 Tax=Agaribacterium haliotis TaxID=2013869 RepID=UPI000BB554C1|nr:DNA helicase II [Agaribacterium haliotis]